MTVKSATSFAGSIHDQTSARIFLNPKYWTIIIIAYGIFLQTFIWENFYYRNHNQIFAEVSSVPIGAARGGHRERSNPPPEIQKNFSRKMMLFRKLYFSHKFSKKDTNSIFLMHFLCAWWRSMNF